MEATEYLGDLFFSPLILEDDNVDRLGAVKLLADLTSRGCVGTLSDVFGQMADNFEREVDHMKSYLTAWDEILRKRKSASIEATITVSNVGKFDTYIHEEIRAAIGAEGESEKNSPRVGCREFGGETTQFVPPCEEPKRKYVHVSRASG